MNRIGSFMRDETGNRKFRHEVLSILGWRKDAPICTVCIVSGLTSKLRCLSLNEEGVSED